MIPATAYVAAGAVIAALITSSISFVNLVISKDQKTSEFRQTWIDALRDDISKLIGKMYNISTLCYYYMEKHKGDTDKAMAELVECVGSDIASVTKFYQRIILRLNPDDDKKLLDAVTALYDMLSDIRTHMIKHDEIEKISDEITTLSHDLLKKEWKRVKRGEWSFVITKYGSLLLTASFLYACYYNKEVILKVISTEINHSSGMTSEPTKDKAKPNSIQ